MNGASITKFDRELVEVSEVFIAAAKANPESCGVLEKYGFSREELDRGIVLCREARRAFEWEAQGKAWNFISTTPERREVEAKGWYADRRRRYVRACLKRAEEKAGWVGYEPSTKWPLWQKLTVGTALAVLNAKDAVSVSAWRAHRAELADDLARAAGEKPAGAPPPKDTALVELAGWYERWRLLAQRVFRQRPDLMAPYGLKPGKAPPRLRGKEAVKYGEKAAGKLDGAACGNHADDDEDESEPEPVAEKPAARAPEPARLPVVS